MTIATYRLTPDGKDIGRTRRRTIKATPDPERVADSLAWPPCRCPRCRTGYDPRAR
ncbi:hypothetical protein [Streptomyces sp. TRM68367]|uniref:hypothetical protein n=1 Tax=Streptomyces sp. TRM68367 TaxID=2758415 RepID=UPI00165B43CA|nr:hypothetical protein [Streptomyces sp. TRM68367]MBC9731490.1 hypothetical protein [Streptomyces sp. TRM68367]